MTTACIQYRALEEPEIRLIRLKPGTWDERIACYMEYVDLRMSAYAIENAAEYTALSYTWGVEMDAQEILVDERPCKITKNLLEALRRLRDHFGPIDKPENRLWIDALSINQADPEEKSRQIPRMKQIYLMAQRVIVWLGENGENDCGVAKVMSMLYRVAKWPFLSNDIGSLERCSGTSIRPDQVSGHERTHPEN